MTTKQVIAYYLHENEQAEVGQAIHDAEFTDAYAVGEMDEAAIAALENQGIIVEVLDPHEEDQTPGGPGLEMRSFASATRGPAALEGMPQAPSLHPTKDNIFLVKLAGPVLLEPWREEIEGLGIRFDEYLPPAHYTASLSLNQVAALKSLPFVKDVKLQAPDATSGVVFTEVARSAPSAPVGMGLDASVDLVYDIGLHRAGEMPDVEQWLGDHGVKVIARGKRKVRVEIAKGSPLINAIRSLREVSKIQEFVAPELSNDAARRLLGLEDTTTGLDTLGQTGAGEIVAVADSGLDFHHPDFQGRVRSLIARGRSGDASDPHGHGTHVAGSAVGDGSASGGKLRGTAPEAELVFQSIMDNNGGLGGLPVELEELFGEAYQEGARIHNNSWSADTKSFYTFNSEEVDEFVYENPDFLVVIAAGNKGTAEDSDPLNDFALSNSRPGFVNRLSMGSPATAKNALTVGASRSDRTSGGLAA
ncbi:MAG: S8 family serine peptidase, partial [Pseudomonadota bacterium]|nr:S8 family serine peptidase [Pseudomonadota bacterium]